MSAVRGPVFSWRVAGWVACSTGAVAVVGGGVASLVSIAAGSDPLPVWGQVAWWTAAAVFALVLGLGCGWARPSVRRFLLTSMAAAVTYVVLGSALLTVDSIGAVDPDGAGSGWGSAVEGAAVLAIVIYGNGAVAVAAPLALGLLRLFRPALFGQPARWSHRPYTSADEDAAAEDFNID